MVVASRVHFVLFDHVGMQVSSWFPSVPFMRIVLPTNQVFPASDWAFVVDNLVDFEFCFPFTLCFVYRQAAFGRKAVIAMQMCALEFADLLCFSVGGLP